MKEAKRNKTKADKQKETKATNEIKKKQQN